MNVRNKALLAGGLSALAVLVWGHGLMSHGETPPPREERQAETGAESAAAEAPAPEASPAAGATPAPDSLASLSALEARLVGLDEGKRGADLAAVMALLGAGEPSEGRPAPAPELAFAVSSARIELQAFAERNALTGVIHGGERSAALLGHRVVRVGDVLAGGRIRVARIEPGLIELSAEGEALVLELPAFHARGGASPSASGATPAGVAPAESKGGGA
jgi:hypothetical protein